MLGSQWSISATTMSTTMPRRRKRNAARRVHPLAQHRRPAYNA